MKNKEKELDLKKEDILKMSKEEFIEKKDKWISKNKENISCNSCKYCDSCNSCEYCDSCKYCDSCYSCEYCDSCYSCYSCDSCSYCKNLQDKKYCIFNVQLTKEEYIQMKRKLSSLKDEK